MMQTQEQTRQARRRRLPVPMPVAGPPTTFSTRVMVSVNMLVAARCAVSSLARLVATSPAGAAAEELEAVGSAVAWCHMQSTAAQRDRASSQKRSVSAGV